MGKFSSRIHDSSLTIFLANLPNSEIFLRLVLSSPKTGAAGQPPLRVAGNLSILIAGH